ncbi:MAG TPA: [protein-PII] uridylyltransferase [Actinomycetota bacterium]|nr:[protein-PII] uridylyltransferase [Actinomycetota bacterium]
MPSSAETSSAIRELRAERERLKEQPGRSGRDLVEALTAAMDAAVRAVWREVSVPEGRVALVALGGYGRGELSPHSDIDLMVLHAGRGIAPDVGKGLFYELWDAGFVVGHAIRTVRDSLKLAAVNLEAETSFIDARLLAGDEELFEDFRSGALKQTRKRGGKFVEALREEAAERHAREGHASYLLEPNLKDGAGGLRDRSVVGWLAKVFGGGGELSAVEEADLTHAGEMLFRARNQLHYLTDRPSDVLLLGYQEQIAASLGYRGNGRPAVDGFLRDLYAAARVVEFAASSALAERLGELARRRSRRELSPGIALEDGRVRITERVSPAADPSLAMRVFAEAATEGAPVAAETLGWLRREAQAGPAEYAWTAETRRAFFRLLGAGERAAEPLEAMDQAGLLGRFLPEWEGVRCQPQHNVYHRFTVDVHLLTTVAWAAALGASDEDDSLPRDVWRDLADRDRVLLACLLHDIGKGTEEDHSVYGESLARQICKRIGLPDETTDDVVWLVRHHLLLPDTATRRDIEDENLVVETAAGVGDAERLKMLYVLSVADGLATGPAAWSPWKGTLVDDLFTRVMHVFERGEVVGRDASDLLRHRTTELRRALARYPDATVEAHLHKMPRAYFLAFPTEALIRHFALMESDLGPSEVRVHWTPGEAPGVYELIVVARDRPGLFSKAAGAIALNGINVLAAQIFTRADGLALEAFRVEGAHEPEIEADRWGRVEANLARALAGRISLDLRLAEKRDAYERPSKGKREPPRVVVDNRVSDFYTVVEVHATDRVGLLYGITRALADMELDIHAAKVATYADDVVDVFYVRDVDGQKVTDPEHMREIERTVLMRIGD